MANYLSPGVFVEETAGGSRPVEGVATAVAAFVGFAEEGPLNEPVRITNWSQYTKTFGDFVEGSYLAHSVYGYFANGGGTCYVVRVGGQAADADAVGGAQAVSAAAPAQVLGGFKVAALPAAAGREIAVDVQRKPGDPKARRSAAAGSADKTADKAADKAKAGKDGAPEAGGAEDLFSFTVKVDGVTTEAFDVSAEKSSASYVVTQVKQHSKFVFVEESTAGAALALPESSTLALPAAPSEGVTTAEAVTKDVVGRYVGKVSDRSGLSGLEAIDDITMVVAPDLMAAHQKGSVSREQVKAIQLAMINHCENMANRMAILDPLPDMSPSEVYDWRQNEAGFDSKYAALYYPWIQVADPVSGKGFLMPPSGHVAGLWARNDEARGVHKAPANEVVRGALDLGVQVTKGEQEQLNPAGINCIRSFPGRGIRIWGARTLSSDPAWRYLNVRRLFNYLEESVYLGSQWVVFEPNDERLWSTVRRNVSAFLHNEWRAGALFGASPDEAFYVKCDAETNPPEVIDAGQVVCEIGVAPVKPAEFVVFRIAQESLGGGGGGGE
ncbi:phage tail sheath family protein [Streptomyces morookaense]|uniref:Phage tail sheath family protein n=1 Tax=Streptomyces morookaense TaxID=1970 RepID=A0A7Y7E830_STRMO|nr:phage tail sheath subtilisin-like domain-containing protein [Streptomyces morookaense]NVK78887.1 phage tail sheath family protein [Streptomyces morookaense]GHF35815.1 tail protein [Streptomyces morookaense]